MTPKWGPEDHNKLEWLHLHPPTKKQLQGRLEVEKGGLFLIRAISPPFMLDGKLQQEVKYVGYSDDDAGVMSYVELLDKYGMDEEYMEWVYYWFHNTKGRQLHNLITKPLSRVHVRFCSLLSSVPTIPLEVRGRVHCCD